MVNQIFLFLDKNELFSIMVSLLKVTCGFADIQLRYLPYDYSDKGLKGTVETCQSVKGHLLRPPSLYQSCFCGFFKLINQKKSGMNSFRNN